MTSVAVIGTGALGGYYGARLAQSGAVVHALCRRDAAWIRDHGLVVESVGRGMLHARVFPYETVAAMPRCEVVIVALKTTANDQLPSLLPPVVKPGGAVLVLQNGWGIEDDAARAAPGLPVFGGLCFIGANKTGPGWVRHLDYGDILLGWHEGSGTAAEARAWLARLAAAFTDARVPVRIADDLRLARWRKLVWNIPFNGLSVLHRATTDVIMGTAVLRAEVVALMREVQVLAAADGCAIEDAFLQQMLDVTDRMNPYKTSMLLDAEAGHPLELDAIYARPLAQAERLGVPAPRIRALHQQLATGGVCPVS